jgi:SAM-dependent methyltransferase
MRTQCVLSSTGVAVVGGSAEAIPLRQACADLITVAQAFHWFDPPRALHEAARVLRPGGTLALVWNERDTTVDWMATLERILHGVGRSAQRPGDIVAADFDGDRHFGPFTRFQVGHQVEMTPVQVGDLVASRSYVRVLGEPERRAVLAEVAALVEPLGATVRFPYVTRAYCAKALPDGCGCGKEG